MKNDSRVTREKAFDQVQEHLTDSDSRGPGGDSAAKWAEGEALRTDGRYWGSLDSSDDAAGVPAKRGQLSFTIGNDLYSLLSSCKSFSCYQQKEMLSYHF